MSNYRVVICEACAGEIDDGECPVCEGTRLAVIETQEIENVRPGRDAARVVSVILRTERASHREYARGRRGK